LDSVLHDETAAYHCAVMSSYNCVNTEFLNILKLYS